MIVPLSFRRLGRLLLVAAASLAACTENDVGSQSCPALCPNTNVAVRDTSFEVELADTTLAGFPLFGTEAALLVADVPGTLDVRGVIRFDSLSTAYLPPGFTADSAPVPITRPDSARLFLRVDTLNSRVPSTFTINLYDVDTTTVDSLTQQLVPLYTAARLLGTRTFTRPEWLDTVSIPVDTAKLRVLVTTAGRVRFGLKIVAPPGQTAMARLATSETSVAPQFIYKAAPDSGATIVTLSPRSRTPLLFSTAQASFIDFSIVVQGTPGLAANTMAVGGIPARRPVITFTGIPSALIDSAQVVRATLTLTQLPRPGYLATDTAQLVPLPFVASTAVTDPVRAANMAQPFTGVARLRYATGAWTDSLKLLPADTGQKKVELTAIFREWRLNPTLERRLIALKVKDEGFTQADLRFWSRSAPTGLRPRLRIQYIPAPTTLIP